MSRSRQPDTPAPGLLRIMRRFRPYIAKRRWLIGGSSAALFAEVGCRLLEPWPLKFIFDLIASDESTRASSGGLIGSMEPATLLAVCAGALVVIVAARAFAAYLRRVGFALAGNLVLTECRAELFAHLQRLSLSFHTSRKTGDLITRVTGDVGRLQEVVSTAALPLFAHIVTVLAMVVVMLLIDWRLAMVAIAVLPLFWLSTRRIGRHIRSTARKERLRHGEMGAIAAEAIGSIKTVQTLSAENVHGKRFSARNISSLREGVRGKRLNALLLGTADVLIAAGTGVVLWYGAKLALRDAIPAGDLIVFLFYLKNTTRPIRNVAKYAGRLAKASASAERILEILDTTPEISERPDATEAPTDITAVAFEDVTFGYEPGRPALAGVSLVAEKDRIIALAGPSGAGKTTIANLLSRLFDPQSGRITFDGQDLRSFTLESLRRRIAVVPQENVLFGVSIRENIAFGAPEISDAQIVEAATLACAHDFISALPDGYDTVLGERGATLSEGQRQRIALARAAVRDAPILVFDEPTASLDSENNRAVCRAIRNLSHGRICFVITHDLYTVHDAAEILYLDGGGVLERGTHEELIRLSGRYAEMYRRQAAGTESHEVIDAQCS